MIKRSRILLLTLMVLGLVSCGSSENHKFDGHYSCTVFGMNVQWFLNGTKLRIENSTAGISEMTCKQLDDGIEYTETNGVKKIIKVLANGDLEAAPQIIFKKVKDDEPSEKTKENKK